MKSFTLLAVLCWCFVSGQAMHISARPLPLDSAVTWNDLTAMVKHAQTEDKDHETRLIPVLSEIVLKEDDSCCINANFLEYFLNHILDEHADKIYPMMRFVRSDLKSIENVLQPSCNSDYYFNHPLVKKYKKNYRTSANKNLAAARNKAIGETNILFHYLFESCSPV